MSPISRTGSLVAFVVAVALLLTASVASAQPPAEQAIEAKIRRQGFASVIAVARDPRAEPNDRAASAQARAALISEARAAGARSVRPIDDLPYVEMRVDERSLARLRSSAWVDYVVENAAQPPHLDVSVPRVGGTRAWSAGAGGRGQTIAVLDTGVQSNHPFLGGRVVLEACFSTQEDTGVSSLCPGSVTASTSVGSAIPQQCTSVGNCNHGTHVAGIAAGRGPSFTGVAPEAQIIAVQVFSKFTDDLSKGYIPCSGQKPPAPSPCRLTTVADQIRGLNFVAAVADLNLSAFRIAAVNMSIGGGQFSSSECTKDPRRDLVKHLAGRGVTVVASSGNDASSTGIGAPACIPEVVAVAAVDDQDQVYAKSNTSSELDLFAPGVGILSSWGPTRYAFMTGTSMAAPHVTGAIAALRSRDPFAPRGQIVAALRTSDVQITDTRNGVTKPRLSVGIAMTQSGAIPFAGDVDGDGEDELVSWYLDGAWFWSDSDGEASGYPRFGTIGDVPMLGDIDRDGDDDLVIFRPSSGTWHALDARSETVTMSQIRWGRSGDVPFVADVDGDERDDLVIWRPSTGQWFAKASDDRVIFSGLRWGNPSDVPFVGDVGGGRGADLVIWRPSSGGWYAMDRNGAVLFKNRAWGVAGDVPLVADLNHDERDELVIYRPTSGEWYALEADGSVLFRQERWGCGNGCPFQGSYDIPLVGDPDGRGNADLMIQRGPYWYARSWSGEILFRNVLFGAD